VLTGKRYSDFSLGDKSQRIILLFFYVAAMSYLVIVLLNMLIAIMQNTFRTRREVATEVKIKDHLKFVLDNWHLMDYALKNKSSMKYVIACLNADQTAKSDAAVRKIRDNLREIDHQNKENFSKLSSSVVKSTLIVSNMKKDNDQMARREEAHINK